MMKISVSNIAWKKEYDTNMYGWLKENNIDGLEIAPTRIFEENPYEELNEAKLFAEDLYENYGLEIPSIQSIWYGRNENIFKSEEDKDILVEYTKKAIDFASVIGCKNLVFGCPRNRNVGEGTNADSGIDFFKILGDYAYAKGTVLSMEANPVIYNTNYCNTTSEAVKLIESVNSKGFKLNLDFGTIVYNKEKLVIIKEKPELINHVHISEPGLARIERRKEHYDLVEILKNSNYKGYVSLETKTTDDLDDIKNTILYIKELYS